MNAPSSTLKQILRSGAVWRLSGLSYATGILATRGRLLSPADYLVACRAEMSTLLRLAPSVRRVLEFGSGLGGNLISVSDDVGRGLGVDINRGYVTLARRLAERSRAVNVQFAPFDDASLPIDPLGYDLVFSMGVFERIPHAAVERYVGLLAKALAPGATLALYFLSKRATLTSFVRRLGTTAYVFWTEEEIRAVLAAHGLVLRSMVPWGATENTAGGLTHVANMAFCTTEGPRAESGNAVTAPSS